MRILWLLMLALCCFPVFAGEQLLNSYGIKTSSFLGSKHIVSFSHLYGGKVRHFSFVKDADIRGWPELGVFATSTGAGMDAVDMQARISDVYGYLRKVTGEVPPIRHIGVYLVPCGYDFELIKSSFTIGGGAGLSFAFSVENGGDCHSESMSLPRRIVRTLAHESMHAILNFHHPDQALNERAAVTMESCAELVAFGDTSFAKRLRLDMGADDRLDAPVNISLRAKYEDDAPLAEISSYGPLAATNAEGVNRLFALCSERYRQALESAR